MSKRPLSSSPSSSPTPAASNSDILPAQTSSPLSQTTTLAPSPPVEDQPHVTPPEQSSSDSGLHIPTLESQAASTDSSSAVPWLTPTSDDMAFLSALPAPTVQLYDDASSPETDHLSTDSVPPLDEETSFATPSPERREIFSAASRVWTGSVDGRVFHRRDTWAVGEKWGRHMRVIEVGREQRK